VTWWHCLQNKRLQVNIKSCNSTIKWLCLSSQLLMQIADDFIDNVVTASCQLARHRKSSTVEVKDVQFHLGMIWRHNSWIHNPVHCVICVVFVQRISYKSYRFAITCSHAVQIKWMLPSVGYYIRQWNVNMLTQIDKKQLLLTVKSRVREWWKICYKKLYFKMLQWVTWGWRLLKIVGSVW